MKNLFRNTKGHFIGKHDVAEVRLSVYSAVEFNRCVKTEIQCLMYDYNLSMYEIQRILMSNHKTLGLVAKQYS